MRSAIKFISALAFVVCLHVSCEPNGNNNSTDVNTNMREGDDTSRMPYSDSIPPGISLDTTSGFNH